MSLVLTDICKQHADETLLYDINVEFLTGLNVLAGPTLAGKTSLLRIIAGLDRVNVGGVALAGKDITHVPVQKRGFAIVYQQYINYPNFTVYDNIASPLRLAKLAAGEIDKRVRDVAAVLSIEEYLHRMPSELSGGQQQRTAIARALVKDAPVILLDEPLVNLDYKLREQLRREMRAIFAEQNKIAIYATTEPLEAALLGDNLVVMDKGRILQAGPGITLFQTPGNLRVAEILSDPRINSIKVDVQSGLANFDNVLQLNLNTLTQLPDDIYWIALRPHHLHLHSAGTPSGSDIVQFTAVVEMVEVSGSETLIYIRFGQQHWVVQQAGVHQYALGESIDLFFNRRDLLIFASDSKAVFAQQHFISYNPSGAAG